MEKIIANKIADWCIKRNKVTDVQEMAIRYGIELYLDSLLKIIALILLGLLFGKGIETIISISCFCLLRREAGGIHMQTSIGCFLSMCLITVTSVTGAGLISAIPLGITLLFMGLSIVAVWLYAPYTTHNNPITDEEIIKRKKKRAIILIVLLTAITLTVSNHQIRALILIPVIIEIITILPFWKGGKPV